MLFNKKHLSTISRTIAVALLTISVTGGAYATTGQGEQYHNSYSKYVNHTNKSYRPQAGKRVMVLPSSKIHFTYKHKPYYFSHGVVYALIGHNQYQVVNIAEGMIIPNIPRHELRVMRIGKKIYYEHYGIIYQEVRTRSGSQYQVVGRMG